jgi:hypothetical protein
MFELWQPGRLQLKRQAGKTTIKKKYPPSIPSLQMRWDFYKYNRREDGKAERKYKLNISGLFHITKKKIVEKVFKIYKQ